MYGSQKSQTQRLEHVQGLSMGHIQAQRRLKDGAPWQIMRTTPMPALPAPATTNRWSFRALCGRPFTFIAPYRPATAVAAVPCGAEQCSALHRSKL